MNRAILFLTPLCLQAVFGMRLKRARLKPVARQHGHAQTATQEAVPNSQGNDSANIDHTLLQKVSTFAPSSFLQTPEKTGEELLAQLRLPPYLAAKATPVRHLGSGSFGDVFLLEATCTNAEDKFVALKVGKVKSAANASVLDAEANIMRGIRSPHVVSLVGSELNHDGSIFMMLPYQNKGELWDFILDQEKRAKAPELAHRTMQVAFWFQSVQGVGYLHEKGITHMDLKPENLLINCKRETFCHATVIDLGLACASKDSREIVINEYSPCSDGNGTACISRIEDDVKATIVDMRTGGTEIAQRNHAFFASYDANGGYRKVFNKAGLAFTDLSEVLLNSDHYPVKFAYFTLPFAPPEGCTLRGSPGYISPESVTKAERTPTSVGHPSNDLYALGAMLYLIATEGTIPNLFPWLDQGMQQYQERLDYCQELLAGGPNMTRRVAQCEDDLADPDVTLQKEIMRAAQLYRPQSDSTISRIHPPLLQDLIRNLLSPAPKTRRDAGDIMKIMPQVMEELMEEGENVQTYIDMINLLPHSDDYEFKPPACLDEQFSGDIGGKQEVERNDSIPGTIGHQGARSMSGALMCGPLFLLSLSLNAASAEL